MAYSVVPLVTTGDDWSAADHNTYIKDNLATTSPAIIQAAGDLIVASGSAVLDRLPVKPYSVLVSDSDSPVWLEGDVAWHTLRVNVAGDGYEFGTYPFVGEICGTTSGASQSIASGSDVMVAFTESQAGEYSMWESSSPTKITIPADFPDDRWYKITGYFYFQAATHASDTGFREIACAVNGTKQEGWTISTYKANAIFHMCFHVERKLSHGDYVEMVARHAYPGGNLNIYDPQLAVIMLR